MAEIKIEKKKPILPWILLGLGVLALLYFLFFKNDDVVDDTRKNETEKVRKDVRATENVKKSSAVVLSAMAISKISEYKSYIANDAKMGVDHEYSNNALTRLIDATEAVANSLEVDIKADLEKARENAAEVTKNPTEMDHSNKIKKAGDNIAQALEKIQRQKYPTLNNRLEDLQESLAAIAPDKKALDQKSTIKNFFKEADRLLTNMKNI